MFFPRWIKTSPVPGWKFSPLVKDRRREGFSKGATGEVFFG